MLSLCLSMCVYLFSMLDTRIILIILIVIARNIDSRQRTSILHTEQEVVIKNRALIIIMLMPTAQYSNVHVHENNCNMIINEN